MNSTNQADERQVVELSLVLSLEQDVYVTSLLSRLRDLGGGEMHGKIARPSGGGQFPETAGWKHVCTYRGCGIMSKTFTSPSQTESLPEERTVSGHKVTLSQDFFENNSHQERKNQFSSME